MNNNNNNNNFDWEYFQVRKFYDGFGRELESQTCEYCNKVMPVQLFETEDGMPSPFPNAHRKILMKQVTLNNKKTVWCCLDCLKELEQEKQNY